MKVGILSLHHYKNYGGLLQNYALYKSIQNIGHTPVVIDYRVSGKRLRAKTLSSLLSPSIYIRKLRTVFVKPKNKRAVSEKLLSSFYEFKKNYMCFTNKADDDNIGQITKEMDAVIVGSDQIWNGLDKKQLIYFFDWKEPFKGLKISYAACSVVAEFAKHNSEKIKKCLNDFNHLSIRDRYTEKFVKDFSGITPETVLDPAYLYDFKEFTTTRVIEEPYIFAYILGPEIKGGREKLLSDIRNKYDGIKIVAVIIEDVSLEAEEFADTAFCDASPENWVNLIYHSEFVLTDSFHGTVFALKYKKPFISYYSDFARASRLIDMAEQYSIHNWIVGSIDDYIKKDSLLKNVDYDTVLQKISEDINKSIDFLKKSLS
jgi:hypothetical protein